MMTLLMCCHFCRPMLWGISVGSRQQQEEPVQSASSRDLRVHVEIKFDFHDEGVNSAFNCLE